MTDITSPHSATSAAAALTHSATSAAAALTTTSTTAPAGTPAALNDHLVDLSHTADSNHATLLIHNVNSLIPAKTYNYLFYTQLNIEDDINRHEVYIPTKESMDLYKQYDGALPRIGQVWVKTSSIYHDKGCSSVQDTCHGPEADYYIALIRNLASGVNFEDFHVLPNGDCKVNLELKDTGSISHGDHSRFLENLQDKSIFELSFVKDVVEARGQSPSQLCSYANPAFQNFQYFPFLDKARCVSQYLSPGDIIDVKPGLISYYQLKPGSDRTCDITDPFCDHNLYGEYSLAGFKGD